MEYFQSQILYYGGGEWPNARTIFQTNEDLVEKDNKKAFSYWQWKSKATHTQLHLQSYAVFVVSTIPQTRLSEECKHKIRMQPWSCLLCTIYYSEFQSDSHLIYCHASNGEWSNLCYMLLCCESCAMGGWVKFYRGTVMSSHGKQTRDKVSVTSKSLRDLKLMSHGYNSSS